MRFGLFHLLQASARAERRSIPSKGLTGTGYDGHAFWDTEGFVLPVLTYTAPHAVRDALRWRASTLELAKERAAELGLDGASFPWRTIRGQECSAYWPAGTAAWHINADIAMAFDRYRTVTGDESLEEECGLAVLIQTARLWLSLGHHDRHGVWHLDGVTGPDEYTAIVRDNVFTNLMAAHNLVAAAEACARHPDAARAMGVTTEETAAWRDAADAVHIPYDEELGVHQQCEGFTTLAEWDFEANTTYPLLLHEAYVRLYPAQVIKQADLVLAMQWQSHAFTPEQKARNVDYYERRMVRDSSLSACTQAVMCAEVGHLDLAHDYAYEAALIDLRDLHQNTRDGLHMASLAGAWTALVVGFGGLRDDEGILDIDPQLPDGITRLQFRLRWRGFRLTVDANHADVSYTLRDGPGTELTIRHAGEDLTLKTDSPSTIAVRPRKPLLPPPPQPPGREPVHRRAMSRGQCRFDDPGDLGAHGLAQFGVRQLVDTGRGAQDRREQPPTELQRKGIGDRKPRTGVIVVAWPHPVEQLGNVGKALLQLRGRIPVEHRPGHDPHLPVKGPFEDVGRRAGVQQTGQIGAQVIKHGTDQLVLGAEVPKHQSVVDLRSGGDVADRRRGRTPLGEQVGGGLQDRRGHLFPPGGHLPASGCRTCSHVTTLTDVVN